MCDYSLMMIHNRLAVEGEELVAHRFNSGSVGMVSRLDFNDWRTRRSGSFWQRLSDCFSSSSPPEPAPVVCIPPGALLRLKDIPWNLRDRFSLDSREDAAFAQISAEENRNRDALLFANGNMVTLQLLPEGQAATVLRLSAAEAISLDPELAQTV